MQILGCVVESVRVIRAQGRRGIPEGWLKALGRRKNFGCFLKNG